jgi:hypothetical protein
LIAISISGCTGSSQDNGNISTGQYVALFEMVTDSYTILEGQPLHPVMMAPLPPSFDYDVSHGQIRQYTPVNDSLKIVFGKYYFTNDVSRNRGMLDVKGIYYLPFSPERNLTIDSIDANGTVHMTYNGEPVSLAVGDMWNSPVTGTWTETQDHYLDIISFVNGTPETKHVRDYYKVRWNSTFYVQNKGLFDKSDVK